MKIKKSLVATAAVAAVAIGLTGCSTSGDASTSAGKISGTVTGVFDSQYKSAMEPLVTDFEKKYPDVTVKMNYQSGTTLNQVILTQIQGGTAPDIIMSWPGGDPNISGENVIPLAAHGYIAPITASWTKDIPDTWKSQVEYKGKVYGYPGAVQPLSAMYNETLLTKYGLKAPTTLDQVYQLCTEAKKHGVYAYAQGLGDASAGPQMLSFAQTASLIYGADPTWDSGLATGKSTYVGSGWETQFGIYQKMNKAGCFGDGALGRSRTQGQQAVAQRQALGLVDVGAVLATIQQSDPHDKFIVTAMPGNNSGKNYITALPIYSLTVNAKAKNMAAAKAFVEFAGEPAESAKFAEGFNAVPLIPDSAFKPSAELESFSKLVQSDKTAPLANVQPAVQTALNSELQAMLLGNLSPEGVAQKMQAAYQKQ